MASGLSWVLPFTKPKTILSCFDSNNIMKVLNKNLIYIKKSIIFIFNVSLEELNLSYFWSSS